MVGGGVVGGRTEEGEQDLSGLPGQGLSAEGPPWFYDYNPIGAPNAGSDTSSAGAGMQHTDTG